MRNSLLWILVVVLWFHKSKSVGWPSLFKSFAPFLRTTGKNSIRWDNATLQKQEFARGLIQLELGVEIVKFHRWIISAWLILKAIEKFSLGLQGFTKDVRLGDVWRPPSRPLPVSVMRILNECNISAQELDEAEMSLASTALTLGNCSSANGPDQILLGLDKFKRQLQFCIDPHVPAHQRLRSTLLFGPPGCGKTALVRWFTCRGNVPVIHVRPSQLLRAYVGQSSTLLRAVFSLAQKLGNCCIFVDEMDALFRDRALGDHAVYTDIKTEFMQLWSGYQDHLQDRTIIVGATNRPQDLDPAILRRFESIVQVPLPSLRTRYRIFCHHLIPDSVTSIPPSLVSMLLGNRPYRFMISGGTKLDTTRFNDEIDCWSLAMACAGFSCSDIINICNQAQREAMMRSRQGGWASDSVLQSDVVAAINNHICFSSTIRKCEMFNMVSDFENDDDDDGS